ncbi:hypothetical protein EIP91_011852 [Steccherinum ochraceum]|uniref:Uncharacterized protein n=1 Tax=Steccherinum ochraceum TaxID=92696 RepID=A0A4R0RP32_9APHY|nr:hypothetical protein EIP91_011852 [Steccherinum ochraceum]
MATTTATTATTGLDAGAVSLVADSNDYLALFNLAAPDLDAFNFTTPVTTRLPADHPDSPLSSLRPPRTTPLPADVPDSPVADSIAISTTFHPAFTFLSLLPDSIFLSSDAVYFFVHRVHLSRSSRNNFNSLLMEESFRPLFVTDASVISVPEDSALLDVVLHGVYDLPFSNHNLSLPTLLRSIHSLQTYGVPLYRVLSPSSRLYRLILAEAPRAPLEVYAVAALHDLDYLAVAISAKLHSIALADISNLAVVTMGPIYLKRLFLLHYRRIEYLKTLLTDAPDTHPEGLALASFVCSDLSIGTLRWTLASLLDRLDCEQCKSALSVKIRQIVVSWCEAKATI